MAKLSHCTQNPMYLLSGTLWKKVYLTLEDDERRSWNNIIVICKHTQQMAHTGTNQKAIGERCPKK